MNPLLLSDCLVSMNGATVASGLPRRPGLCLEADFHHVCRLSKSDRHSTSGTSRKQSRAEADV